MARMKGKYTVRSFFMIAGPLLAASCTSIMAHTPQQMSDIAINTVKVDPQTDPNPQALAADQVACANKARLQYPIGVDEARIMTGSIIGGTLDGAASGAAGSAGSGNAGRATAASSIAGLGQGGLNGINNVKLTYMNQAYQQMIHYGLCLAEQGHTVYEPSERDLTCARVGTGCPIFSLVEDRLQVTYPQRSDVGFAQLGPAPTSDFDGTYAFVSATKLNETYKHGTGQCPDVTASPLTTTNGQVPVFWSVGGVAVVHEGSVDAQGQLTTRTTNPVTGTTISGYGKINGDGTINLR